MSISREFSRIGQLFGAIAEKKILLPLVMLFGSSEKERYLSKGLENITEVCFEIWSRACQFAYLNFYLLTTTWYTNYKDEGNIVIAT